MSSGAAVGTTPGRAARRPPEGDGPLRREGPDRVPGADPLPLLLPVGAMLLLAGWTRPLWSPWLGVVCPLRALVGLPCPTCGGTRAFAAAVRGDWLEALSWNPLVAAGATLLLVGLPIAAAAVAGRWRRPRLGNSVGLRLRLAAIAALTSNWLYLVAAGV